MVVAAGVVVSAEAEGVEVAAVVAALAEAEGAVATAIRTTSREDQVTGSANFLSAETQTSPGETSATSATRLGKSVAQDPVTEAAEVAELSEVVVEGEGEHQVPEARVQGAFLTEELTEVHAELKQERRITTKRPFRNFVDVIM